MKLSVHFRQPFTIFEIEGFFEPSEYSEALNQFPMDPEDYVAQDYGKYTIKRSTSSMIKIKESSDLWRGLFDRFSSGEVLPVLRLCEEANDKPPGTYAFVSVNPITNLLNKVIRRKTLITSSFEFSLLRHPAKIVPHTDSANKVVTIMLYFPDPELGRRADLGTFFYHFPDTPSSKYENFANQHYTEERFPNFYEDCKVLFQTSFTEQRIYGFVKNAFSWHAVPDIQPGAGEARRSLNVNYNLFAGGIFRPAIDLLKIKMKAAFQR